MARIWKQTLDLIRRNGGAATSQQVSRLRGCSYNTARAHLNNLAARGMLERETVDGLVVWILPDTAPPEDPPEPAERLKVTELAPGHRRVSFGAGWRPQPAQRVHHAGQGISAAGLCQMAGGGEL
jgi:hypothetical protein